MDHQPSPSSHTSSPSFYSQTVSPQSSSNLNTLSYNFPNSSKYQASYKPNLNSSRFITLNHLKATNPNPNPNPEKPQEPNTPKVPESPEITAAKQVQKEINNLLNYDTYADLDPTQPAHLLLVIHGVGARPDILLANLLKIRNTINTVRKTKINQYRAPIIIKMIDWKFSNQSEFIVQAKEKIDRITLKSNKKQRIVLNEVPTDILFYLTEDHAVGIINEVANQANHYYDQLSGKFPGLKASILAHSLGSIISYDLITGNKKKQFPNRIKSINFPIEDLFLIGSPLGLFVSLTPMDFMLLDKAGFVKGFYNIFHPNDLVAYRIEQLIPNYPELDPKEVPYMKNDGYKNHTKKKIIEKLKELQDSAIIATLTRYDYVLQEGLIENMFETIGILGGHWGYWESTDLFYFIIKKLHAKLDGPIIPSFL